MPNAIDPAIISCYHAHIYYYDASRDTATQKFASKCSAIAKAAG